MDCPLFPPLSLQSPQWSELQHAYGKAGDIPALLERLHAFPKSEGEAEPWFTLWSALAHQGDVYTASFAAVPHVVSALASAPARADEAFFQFPAWVEICRAKHQIEVPQDLRASYFEALARLPSLVRKRQADLGSLALRHVRCQPLQPRRGIMQLRRRC